MIKSLSNLNWSQYRPALIFIGLLFLLMPPFLYFRYHYTLTRSLLIPAWSISSPFQANIDDWVKIDLISPVDKEIPTDTYKTVLRVRYSLKSQPSATLLIQLRSRLDLDSVDRGSDLSNLLAMYNTRVQNGTGEEIVELMIEPRTLAKFPPGSQILPIASLQGLPYPEVNPNNAYFYQVVENLALRVPDISQFCVFDAEHDSLEVIKVVSPSQFTQASPKAQVTIQYNLLPSHAQLVTLVGGFVNPTSDGKFTDFADWQRQTATWQYRDLETASGTIVLDLYSWFPTESTRQIIGENNQVALALGLVCGGWNSYYKTPKISYSKVFPKHVVAFSSDLLNLIPTACPTPIYMYK